MTIGSTSQLSALLAQMLNGSHPGSTVPGSGSHTLALMPGSVHQGGLTSAVLQALRQIGVTGAGPASTVPDSSSTAAGPSSTRSSGSLALQSFMQTLLAALQPQGGGAAFPLGGHGLGGRESADQVGGGRIAHRLQSLIQELQAPSRTAAPPSSSASSALASLQQSFNQLVSALGSPGGGNSASLGSFLNSLATDLAAKPSTGNLVSVQA